MAKIKRRKSEREEPIRYNEYTEIYLKIIKIGIFLTLLLPLVIVQSQLFLFQFGKVILFRVIIELIALFYLLLIIKEPKYRPKLGILEVSIALFVVIYFITSITGINFWRSFWGTAERMGGFFTFLHFWVFFIIIASVFKNREDWKKLFLGSVAVAAISSLYAVGQSHYFLGFLGWLKDRSLFLYNTIQTYININFLIIYNDWRSFGTIGNAGPFSSYVLFNIFFVLYLITLKNKFYKKIIFFSLFTAVAAGLWVSGTRGAYLAVAAGFLVLIMSYFLFYSNKKTKILMGGILVLSIFLIAYVWINKDTKLVKDSYVLTRFASVSLESGSFRIWAWESAGQALKDKPLLGYGPENFNIAFNKYFNPKNFIGYGSVTWYDRAHNIIVEIITTMGIVGLLSYLSIFVSIYYILFKNRHHAKEDIAAFGLLVTIPVAYFIQNMFWFDDFSSYFMLFLFFAFASSYFANVWNTGEIPEKIKNLIPKSPFRGLNWDKTAIWFNKNQSISLVALILLLIGTLYFTNIKAWIFQDKMTVASAAFQQNDERSFEFYKEAISSSTYLGRYELYKRLGDYVNNIYTNRGFKNKEDAEKMKTNLDFAIAQMELAIQENPYDAQFYLLLGRMYNKYYSFFRETAYLNDAESVLSRGLELSPKRQTILYEYGQVLVFKKDYDKAIDIFRKAKDYYPDVAVSHWYLGLAMANGGKFDEAKSEIEQAIVLGYDYKTNIQDILSIAPIYAELKDYNKLLGIYQDALVKDPNNPDIYESLAMVYKELGDKENAKKMAEKVIELDPTQTAKSQKFIESLK